MEMNFPLYDFPKSVEAATDPAGGYFIMRDADRLEFESLEELIQIGMLGNCGCGMPGDFLEYLINGLRIINKRSEYPSDETEEQRRARWNAIGEEEKKVFGGDGPMYFFFYWCDVYLLTEHGGSVPGWLTDRGHTLLKFLEAWWKEEGSCDEEPKKG